MCEIYGCLIYSILFHHTCKTRQTSVKMGVWSIPFLHIKQGRHVWKGVSVQFHAVCRKGQTCVRFMCVWSIPSFYLKQGRHVWKEVSVQFHVFGRKGQTCMSCGCLIYSILQSRDSGLFLSSLVVQNRPDSGELGLSDLFWGNPRCFLVSALFHTPWDDSCLAYSRV